MYINNMMRFLIYILLFFTFLFNIAHADKIQKFSIIGNKRITNETIIVFSKKKLNQDINESDLNDVIKNLYETNFFKNINVSFVKNNLTINVIENPIIQSIEITGIKSSKYSDPLYEIMQMREKSSYIESAVAKDLLNITNFLKVSGFYFSKVKVELKENDNNTVNLIYNIELGEKASIKKIIFSGNKIYKDKVLKNIIVSEEDKFWKFLSGKKYLDQNRINLDKNLLKNYYLNNGYYNVKINESSVSFIDDGGFNLTYNIDSGQKFYFNNLKLNIPINYDKNNFKLIEKEISELKNETYSFKKIISILDEIDSLALTKQYEFINASIEEKIINPDKLNIIITVDESKKFYVDRININGNDITQETVIRNMLVVDEGDPFNELLNNKSINNIRSSGLFSTVKYDVIDSDDESRKTMNIFVEERPTGEISAGAGVGTRGASFTFGVKEANFNGKGIKTNTNFTLGTNSIKGGLSFEIPNYKYSDKTLNGDISRTITDQLVNAGYKNKTNRIGLSTSFEQRKDLYFSPGLTFKYETLETSSSASAALKKQADNYYDINLEYSLLYDQRNSSFRPSDGYLSVFRQQLPLLSNNYSLTNTYEFMKYNQITDEMIGSIKFYMKTINSIGSKDVRISQRLNIASKRLRGFQAGKVGPKDGIDFVGGNYASTVSLGTTLPKFLPQLQFVDFGLFLDAGNIWGADYSKTIENKKNKIKSAAGLSIDILTPIGPLNFVIAQPITKSSSDVAETFRFDLGTSF